MKLPSRMPYPIQHRSERVAFEEAVVLIKPADLAARYADSEVQDGLLEADRLPLVHALDGRDAPGQGVQEAPPPPLGAQVAHRRVEVRHDAADAREAAVVVGDPVEDPVVLDVVVDVGAVRAPGRRGVAVVPEEGELREEGDVAVPHRGDQGRDVREVCRQEASVRRRDEPRSLLRGEPHREQLQPSPRQDGAAGAPPKLRGPRQVPDADVAETEGVHARGDARICVVSIDGGAGEELGDRGGSQV
mmetsp:Transcript_13298/g.37807  ORF Transcript_13298/g.37807 Transcript_13298/m.37807 type:complete len:246 (+) Transcript_13298:594-1331(+)